MRNLPRYLLLCLAALCVTSSVRAAEALPLCNLVGEPTNWLAEPLDAQLVEIAAPNCCAPCVSYLQVDSLLLCRTFAGTRQSLVLDTVGDEVLGTQDIGFAFTAGPRITWGFPRVCGDNWEISYFGGVNWESSTTVTQPGDLRLLDPLGSAVPDFSAADQMLVDYSSEIQSFEFSHYRPLGVDGPWSWLAGFRYLHFEEDLNILANNANTGISTYDIGTTNNLVGGQLGGRWRGQAERWNWEFLGKIGLYGNYAGQRQVIIDQPGTVLRDNRGEKNFAAMVTEFGFTGTRQLGRRWSLRAGYNFLLLSGVALAPDQIDFGIAPTSGSVADSRGVVLLHGAVAGLEARW